MEEVFALYALYTHVVTCITAARGPSDWARFAGTEWPWMKLKPRVACCSADSARLEMFGRC